MGIYRKVNRNNDGRQGKHIRGHNNYSSIAKQMEHISFQERNQFRMVTIEEMKEAVGRTVAITCTGLPVKEVFVESYQYEPEDDQEPFLLFEGEYAEYQSGIEKIEIVK